MYLVTKAGGDRCCGHERALFHSREAAMSYAKHDGHKLLVGGVPSFTNADLQGVEWYYSSPTLRVWVRSLGKPEDRNPLEKSLINRDALIDKLDRDAAVYKQRIHERDDIMFEQERRLVEAHHKIAEQAQQLASIASRHSEECDSSKNAMLKDQKETIERQYTEIRRLRSAAQQCIFILDKEV